MRKGFTSGFALVLALVLVGTEPTLAAAQTAGATSPASEDAASRADALFKAANEDLAKQKWAEAEAKLLAAFALNRSYDIAANLGNTQYRLGKYRDAAEHLAFAVRSWPVIGKREQREFSAKRLAEARKFVASVTIRVSSPGAKVLIDGREVGLSPLAAEVFVEPGRRRLEARLEGYEPATSVLESVAGDAHEVSLTLAKIEAKSATNREGEAMKGRGTAQAARGNAGAGVASGGEMTSLEGGPNKVLIIAGIATSAVLVGTGVVFAAASNGRANDAAAVSGELGQRDVQCPSAAYTAKCDEVLRHEEARVLLGNMAFWSIVGGVAVGGGTAIYALVAPRPASKGGMMIVPAAAPHAGGLLLSGVW
jgi:hypothetical protein